MVFSLLTYNTLFNKAYGDLKFIIEKYKPDIICLQELETSEANLRKLDRYGYRLAEYANSFIKFGKIYGVATFYDEQRFKFIESETILLPKNLYEFILTALRILRGGNQPRTLLKTNLTDLKSHKEIVIYNTHLSVVGSNTARMKQIKEGLEDIELNIDLPLVIAGDFNYFPYARKKLEILMSNYGFSEATDNIRFTVSYSHSGKKEGYNFIQRIAARTLRRFFKGGLKVDYIFYKNLKRLETKKIDVKSSDHFPIISKFKI